MIRSLLISLLVGLVVFVPGFIVNCSRRAVYDNDRVVVLEKKKTKTRTGNNNAATTKPVAAAKQQQQHNAKQLKDTIASVLGGDDNIATTAIAQHHYNNNNRFEAATALSIVEEKEEEPNNDGSSSNNKMVLLEDEDETEEEEEEIGHVLPRVLPLRNTIVLHVGKAGGGTVLERFRMWKLRSRKWCHPDPCHEQWIPDDDDNEEEQEEGQKTVIVTVRDPVDRFYSAFNWRSLVVCRPAANETRIMGHTIRNKPDKFCKLNKIEYKLLHEKYHGDANELAEALCDPRGEVRRQTLEDIRRVSHLRHFLTDWIPPEAVNAAFLPSSSSSSSSSKHHHHLIGLIQEPGFDFTSQIDAGLGFALNMTTVANKREAIAKRRHGIFRKNNQQPPPASPFHNKKLLHHSAKDYQNQTTTASGGKAGGGLSPLGACCVARQLWRDYELLETLERTACWGDEADTCRNALRSILDRRKVFLESRGDTTCRAIIKGNNNIIDA